MKKDAGPGVTVTPNACHVGGFIIHTTMGRYHLKYNERCVGTGVEI